MSNHSKIDQNHSSTVCDDQNNQQRIWDHFQNRAPESFKGAKPRLDYIVKQIIRNKQNKRPSILNIGAGDGYLEYSFKKIGWDIYSLDPNEEVITRMIDEGVKGHCGSIEHTPFSDHTFDFVVASEVLEHLTDDQRKQGLKEIARILKEDGYFIGTVPYCEDLFLNEVVCPKCGDIFNRWGHQRSFDCSDIRLEFSPFFKRMTIKTTAFVSFLNEPLFRKIKNLVYLVRGKLGSKLLTTSIYFSVQK